MSKGKWTKGPVSPRLTLFMRIARVAKETNCSHCKTTLPVSSFSIKLSAAYGATRYWTFCLHQSCLQEWAYAKLLKQALEIAEKRGTNPLDEDPYYPQGHTFLSKETL